jgi:L-fuconate dehydratase
VQDRVIEYVDHLHEHFVAPVVVREGAYLVPDAPGSGGTMRAESLERYSFPHGEVWLS